MNHDITFPGDLEEPFNAFEGAREKLIDSVLLLLMTNGIPIEQLLFHIGLDCSNNQEPHRELLARLQKLDWHWYQETLMGSPKKKAPSDMELQAIEMRFRANASLPESALVQVTNEVEPLLKIVATDIAAVKDLYDRMPNLAATAERAGIPRGRCQLYQRTDDGLVLRRNSDATEKPPLRDENE